MTTDHRIRTPLGNRINLLDLKPADISLDDCAQGLSRICRYNNFSKDFYSVAQHSILVSEWIKEKDGSPELQMHGLLHDTPESYSPVGDVCSPIKPCVALFSIKSQKIVNVPQLESEIIKTIYKALGIRMYNMYPPIVSLADKVLLNTELRDIMGTEHDSKLTWSKKIIANEDLKRVKEEFISKFKELKCKIPG